MMGMDSRRMCPNCRAFITAKDRVCPYCDERVGDRAIDRRDPSPIAGLIPAARFSSSMILLLNLAMFAATVAYSSKSGNPNALMGLDGETLYRFGASVPGAAFRGEWWRLVTAGFLHGGLFHIAMNSWVLFDLGAQVEELYGTARFLCFYVLATIGGFLVSSLWGHFSVGASAAVFGLIGAMIAMGVRHKQSPMGQAVRGLYIRWAIYGLLFGLMPGLRIDNAAHLGGLATGFALAYIADTPKLIDRPVEKFWRGAAVVSVAVTVLSFLRAYSGPTSPFQ